MTWRPQLLVGLVLLGAIGLVGLWQDNQFVTGAAVGALGAVLKDLV